MQGIDEAQARLKAKAIAREGDAPKDLILPEDLRPAVELVSLSHDQLRVIAGFAGAQFYAFDQVAVQTVAGWHGIEITPDVARDLQALQTEGLRLMREAT